MTKNCKSCQRTFDEPINFCTSCGQALSKHDRDVKVSTINLIISFYVAILVFLLLSYYLTDNFINNFTAEIIIEVLFALIIVGFSLSDYKNILQLYRLRKIPPKIWIAAIVFPIVSSVSVYYFVDLTNAFFSIEESFNYYFEYLDTAYPLFWAIFFVALLPPIFEELAFRGFLFNQIQKISTNKVAIIATAFLFALIHLSFISIVWIFPFGLLLGYLRAKYNTLWVGMLIHFIHNLIIVLLDYSYLFATY